MVAGIAIEEIRWENLVFINERLSAIKERNDKEVRIFSISLKKSSPLSSLALFIG